MTQGRDNVFEDIGFDRAEAASLKVRADLMLGLRKRLEQTAREGMGAAMQERQTHCPAPFLRRS